MVRSGGLIYVRSEGFFNLKMDAVFDLIMSSIPSDLNPTAREWLLAKFQKEKTTMTLIYLQIHVQT